MVEANSAGTLAVSNVVHTRLPRIVYKRPMKHLCACMVGISYCTIGYPKAIYVETDITKVVKNGPRGSGSFSHKFEIDLSRTPN